MQTDGLYETTFPEGWSFLWRLLSLKEYRRFRALRDSGGIHPYILHSMVFDHCYLGEQALLNKHMPAGITIGIGECIMWLSGDCEMSTLVSDIEQARRYYPKDSVKEHMARTVFTAFPSYVEEDLQNWTYPELIRKFIIAEQILVTRIPEYQPLDTRKIFGPEGKKKTPGVVDAKDFKKDNRELRQAMGDQHHPLDMAPDKFANIQKRSKGRLTPSLARKLDQRKRG